MMMRRHGTTVHRKAWQVQPRARALWTTCPLPAWLSRRAGKAGRVQSAFRGAMDAQSTLLLLFGFFPVVLSSARRLCILAHVCIRSVLVDGMQVAASVRVEHVVEHSNHTD